MSERTARELCASTKKQVLSVLELTDFVERYSRKLGKQITSIRKETMKVLQDYPWPGNVRELEKIIERAVILCPGPVLRLTDKLEISSPLTFIRREDIIHQYVEAPPNIEAKRIISYFSAVLSY